MRDAPWFAFLVHPRDASDLLSWRGMDVVRRYSASDEEAIEKIQSHPPVVVAELNVGVGGPRGELVGVPLLPERMLHLAGRRAVHDALRVAISRGAPVVGLGALTAPATSGGETLLADVPPGVVMTNGNAYTAAVVRDNVAQAAASTGKAGAASVAIVGCTGSVGCAATRLLGEDGYELLLIGRTVRRVRSLLGDLDGRARFSDRLDDLGGADVVVALTNDAKALLQPAHVRPGAVVIDVAQPPNVPPESIGAFRRRGVSVVSGGLADVQGLSSNHAGAVGSSGFTFACIAETYLFARAGRREHSVGHASVALARELQEIAADFGVRPARLALEADSPSIRVRTEAVARA